MKVEERRANVNPDSRLQRGGGGRKAPDGKDTQLLDDKVGFHQGCGEALEKFSGQLDVRAKEFVPEARRTPTLCRSGSLRAAVADKVPAPGWSA